MKPRLQASITQNLVLTPQLRQALHLLQLSAVELEAEITAAVESNPLLDWEEPQALTIGGGEDVRAERGERESGASSHDDHDHDRDVSDAREARDERREQAADEAAAWESGDDGWYAQGGGGGGNGTDDEGDASDRMVQTDSLQDHLSWQLHLSPLSARDRRIGAALVDAIDDDGYLRAGFDEIAETLRPDTLCDEDEICAVLKQVQRFDPVGVGARDLGECLRLQLSALTDDVPGRAEALRAAVPAILERLPKLGAPGLAQELGCDARTAETAMHLLRTMDPRPGAQIGGMPTDTYVTPDCVITRHAGRWRVALAGSHQPRLTIHRGYEGMIRQGGGEAAGYLRGRLQEARWLLKNLEARGDTLLKVVRCLVHEQSGFLEFGAQALRPLTLREVAAAIGLHESTVSRAVARKYVHTPRGTLPLRSFFASGIDTEGGGEASSRAIQEMIRGLIDGEDPRKPLSDARLAESLKASGVPVARRTVAKYREAMHIASSHERVRIA